MFDGYYFKGRGFLWHRTKGPIVWWPLNWLWFFVFEQKRLREDAREEKAEKKAAKAAAKEAAAKEKAGVTEPGMPASTTEKVDGA
ncbi:hypothetical protein A33M_4337 [Rhodovulum sp. PH10]|uniref:hypothetical protein n=1 Tax=Rhodovulum sp. PH10 TaxID=1187851 RepID=UPI00027C2D3F|nr:hypothetical protein [Rhodovulum sp. PH10]EJW10500.1 hypothetical protein A33M_4337 [Rhodovulum sp. PH10]